MYFFAKTFTGKKFEDLLRCCLRERQRLKSCCKIWDKVGHRLYKLSFEDRSKTKFFLSALEIPKKYSLFLPINGHCKPLNVITAGSYILDYNKQLIKSLRFLMASLR